MLKTFRFAVTVVAAGATVPAAAAHSSGAANPSVAGFSWATAGSRFHIRAASTSLKLHSSAPIGGSTRDTRQRRNVDTSGLATCTNNRGCPNRDDGSIWFCANYNEANGDVAGIFCGPCEGCEASIADGSIMPSNGQTSCPFKCGGGTGGASTQSPVTVTRTTGAVQPDQDFSECSQMGTAMRTIFNNDVNQYQAFMNGCGSQMETIGTELSNAMVGRASANAVCNNQCLNSFMRMMSRMSRLITDDGANGPCTLQKIEIVGMVKMVGGVVCARHTDTGVRCMETLLDFHTLAQELEQHNSTTHGTQTGGGGGNVTSGGGGGGGYQYAVNMCNDFESAGCCFNSVRGIINDREMQLFSGIVEPDISISESIGGALHTLQARCRNLSMAAEHIGAMACPVASVRGGGIAEGSGSSDLPASRPPRLVIQFPGDLSTLSEANQARVRAQAEARVSVLLGSNSVIRSVTLVGMAGGSFNAELEFEDTVTFAEAESLSANPDLNQMSVSTEEGGTVTAIGASVAETTADAGVNSPAAALAVALATTVGAMTVAALFV